MLAKLDEVPPGPDGRGILQLFKEDITARHRVRVLAAGVLSLSLMLTHFPLQQAIEMLEFYLYMVAERKHRILYVKPTWSER